MQAHESTPKPSPSKLWLAMFSLLLGACSCDPEKGYEYIWHPPEAGVDAGFDAGFDAGNDVDAGQDAGTMTMDAGQDAGMMMMDAGQDAGMVMPVTCAVDLPNSCANAGMHTVTIAPGEIMGVVGRVDSAGDDWFQVDFTGTSGVTTPYHPVINLAQNPGGVYSIDVFSSCGSTATGCATDDQTFEMSWPGSSGTCNLANKCVDNTARQSSFIVRVHRTGVPVNCFTYTIEVSNQP